MISHFTTADGCERYEMFTAYPPQRLYRVPIPISVPRNEDRPFSTPRVDFSYRLYELENIDMAHNMANYREVYDPNR